MEEKPAQVRQAKTSRRGDGPMGLTEPAVVDGANVDRFSKRE